MFQFLFRGKHILGLVNYGMLVSKFNIMIGYDKFILSFVKR